MIRSVVMGRSSWIGLATLALVACSSPSATPASPDAAPTCDCLSTDGMLALPPNLLAVPTFVLSDTCQAFLAGGGVVVRTSTPKSCNIEVTLANGEVLTTTASFEPRPACCSSGLVLAAASPFQTTNAGPPTGTSPDAASNPRFDEWWYPECGTPATNGCPETCGPVKLIAAPAVCGPYEELTAGCVPLGRVVAGWFCLMRSSDGEIIFTEEEPSNPAGFEACPPQIEGNLPRVPSTCPDASAP
jgi:hypothetical protein